ncbi:hypothetical protein ABK040_002704 [Willaertia magna]
MPSKSQPSYIRLNYSFNNFYFFLFLFVPSCLFVHPTTKEVYFCDLHKIRKISSGNIVTVVGNGLTGDCIDGAPSKTVVDTPSGIAVLPSTGELIFMSKGNHNIRKISKADGKVRNLYGIADGSASTSYPYYSQYDASTTKFSNPTDLQVDPNSGDIYFIDNIFFIRKIKGTKIYTVAGTGGSPYFNGNSGVATSFNLDRINGFGLMSNGDIIISEQKRILSLSGGFISTIFGAPYNGMNAKEVNIIPTQVFKYKDELYFADFNNFISKMKKDGTLQVLAGIYFSETGSKTIKKITTTGSLEIVAGPVTGSFGGTLSISPDNNNIPILYFSEGNKVKTVNLVTKEVKLIAGRDTQPSVKDNAPLNTYFGNSVTSVYVNSLGDILLLGRNIQFTAYGIAQHDGGDIYYSTGTSGVILKQTKDGENDAKIAGAATSGYIDGDLTTSRFSNPQGIYFDRNNSVLYVCDYGNLRMRQIQFSFPDPLPSPSIVPSPLPSALPTVLESSKAVVVPSISQPVSFSTVIPRDTSNLPTMTASPSSLHPTSRSSMINDHSIVPSFSIRSGTSIPKSSQSHIPMHSKLPHLASPSNINPTFSSLKAQSSIFPRYTSHFPTSAKSSSLTTLKSSKDCKCGGNQKLVEKDSLGNYLTNKECLSCGLNSIPDPNDRYTCKSCPDLLMISSADGTECLCPTGYQKWEKSCIYKDAYQNVNSKYPADTASSLTYTQVFENSRSGSASTETIKSYFFYQNLQICCKKAVNIVFSKIFLRYLMCYN